MTLMERASTRTAVVGAGMAGLACASHLQNLGMSVTVFEKSRGPSGRMSTRRADGGAQFDHGAQYFTGSDPEFLLQVEDWVRQGHVAEWKGQFGHLESGDFLPESTKPRFVGTPRMSAVGRYMAEGLRIDLGVRVGSMERVGNQWHLRDDDGGSLGAFDRVVLAIPGPQATLLVQAVPRLAQTVAEVDMLPCYALMLRFDEPLNVPWDGVRVDGGPLAWIAHDSSKPGRVTPGCYVAHTTAVAGRYLLEKPPHRVAARLTRAFHAATRTRVAPVHVAVHRWRFARPQDDEIPGGNCLYDADLGVGACGDWRVGARVEAAWLSGRAMADALLGVTVEN